LQSVLAVLGFYDTLITFVHNNNNDDNNNNEPRLDRRVKSICLLNVVIKQEILINTHKTK